MDKGNIDALITRVQNEPNNWNARKAASLKLYEAERYLEAADILWKAPEMPATDVDVAFSIKIVSRARPNRSIRLVYELIRRNAGKPLKNLAMARALNMIGMPMLASRFYGAAVSEDPQLFDLSFEKQTLWYDDSGSLLDQWKGTDQEAKPPLEVPLQDFTGETIAFEKLVAHIGETPSVAQAMAPAPFSMPKPLAKTAEKPVNPATNPNIVRPADSALSKPDPFVAPPQKKEVKSEGPPVVPRPPIVISGTKAPATNSLLRPNQPSSQLKRPTLLTPENQKEED